MSDPDPEAQAVARIPIVGVIEDRPCGVGGEVYFFHDSPAVQFAVVPADQLPAD